MAFDGANIWVTNGADDTVSKLQASDGANLGTFPVGDAPVGVAFDGANIWVANHFSRSFRKCTGIRVVDAESVHWCNKVSFIKGEQG